MTPGVAPFTSPRSPCPACERPVRQTGAQVLALERCGENWTSVARQICTTGCLYKRRSNNSLSAAGKRIGKVGAGAALERRHYLPCANCESCPYCWFLRDRCSRLKEYLRQRLLECGWRDQMKAYAKRKTLASSAPPGNCDVMMQASSGMMKSSFGFQCRRTVGGEASRALGSGRLDPADDAQRTR